MSTPVIYNLGSLNLDRVFRVPHIAAPGETLAASSLTTFPGGKGANQSVALARAGARVVHIGRIGADGQMLRERLAAEGVDVRYVVELPDAPSGQAIIQVDDEGQNSIVILAGANGEITAADVEAALADAPAGSWLLTQNETSSVGEAMQIAKQRGLKIAFNPAPADDRVCEYPAELVDLWCLNETEHGRLHDLLPRKLAGDQEVLLTRGAGGRRAVAGRRRTAAAGRAGRGRRHHGGRRYVAGLLPGRPRRGAIAERQARPGHDRRGDLCDPAGRDGFDPAGGGVGRMNLRGFAILFDFPRADRC